MRIALGTTSQIKIAALEAVLKRHGLEAEVVPVKTASGINEQPEGLKERTLGATNRTHAARKAVPDCDFALGIESGIENRGGRWVDVVTVIYVGRDGSDKVVNYTANTEFPEWAVTEARFRGFDTTTVGQVLAERLGCDAKNPHSRLTGGRRSRQFELERAFEVIIYNLPQ